MLKDCVMNYWLTALIQKEGCVASVDTSGFCYTMMKYNWRGVKETNLPNTFIVS